MFLVEMSWNNPNWPNGFPFCLVLKCQGFAWKAPFIWLRYCAVGFAEAFEVCLRCPICLGNALVMIHDSRKLSTVHYTHTHTHTCTHGRMVGAASTKNSTFVWAPSGTKCKASTICLFQESRKDPSNSPSAKRPPAPLTGSSAHA